MKISGFTYVRNGFKYGYPFIPSIRSLLPLVDELVVVVGNSTDGSKEAIEKLSNPKIKIIDSVWDEELRSNGRIFALQSNLGLDQISGDWAIHLQADEVFHESTLNSLRRQILAAEQNPEVDGLLFPFHHFWGDYEHIKDDRSVHRFEIRAFRNKGCIRSYKDSQGFRKYRSIQGYNSGEKGTKLNCLKVRHHIFHYSYARNPKLMTLKANYFERFWHPDTWLKKNLPTGTFDFNYVGRLAKFKDEHPIYMKETINQKDWDFSYDPSQSILSIKDRFLLKVENLFGYRPFEYKNYKIVEKVKEIH
ncbi:glycosyltransferase [Xanthovirga aplysinae]|uniref:glycosyltransferase n=1 Tax=Xanthovirga aplysinae TaxID=2529853 RepID=UPI0016574D43|nr:glycosyltransferase [Xanthovirga aplysinae]